MIDILVIGAGIVGTWIAYLAAENGYSVAICDQSEILGDGISGRNSGVLHSGIYYSKDSAKLRACLRGYELGIDFLEKYHVPYRICGKLIVSGKSARQEESQIRLRGLFENGQKNGLEDLRWIENPGIQYPHLLGDFAIFAPKTGIVDVPSYLNTLWKVCEEAGVIILKGRKFIFRDGEKILQDTKNPNASEKIEAKIVVNAAGLYSDDVAREFGLEDVEIRPNKGEYFRLKGPLPIEPLVYPMPHSDSTALGVHYTVNMAGEAYAGPNSNWAASKTDYSIDTSRKEYFTSLSQITDFYSEEDLLPGYAGLRPRLFIKGEAIRDFQYVRGRSNSIHLLGIESPGLTSAPGIAEELLEMIRVSID